MPENILSTPPSTNDILNNLIYPHLTHDMIFTDLEPKNRGNYFVMICPFCGGKNEFHAYKDKKYGSCNRKNNCGKYITWWDHVKNRFNLQSNKDVLFKLAELAGVELNNGRNEHTKHSDKYLTSDDRLYDLFFSFCKDALLKSDLTGAKEVYNYLKEERGFSDGEIHSLDFGYLPFKKDTYAYLEPEGFSKERIKQSAIGTYGYGTFYKLVIPFRDSNNRIVGFVSRLHKPVSDVIKDNIFILEDFMKGNDVLRKIVNGNDPVIKLEEYLSIITDKNTEEYENVSKLFDIINLKKYKYSKGLTSGFLNEKAIKGKQRIYIVEGIFDALKLISKGITNVLAMGRDSITANQLSILKTSHLKDVFLFPDNDTAGMDGVKKTIRLLLENDILPYIVTYKKYKDIDEYVRAEGVDPLKSDVENASIGGIWLVKTMLVPPPDSGFTDIYKEKVIDDIVYITSLIKDKGIRSIIYNTVKSDHDFKRPISARVESIIKENIRKSNIIKKNILNSKANEIRKEFIAAITPFMRNFNTKEINSVANEYSKNIQLDIEFSQSAGCKKFIKELDSIISASAVSDFKKLKKFIKIDYTHHSFDYNGFREEIMSMGYKCYSGKKYTELGNSLKTAINKLNDIPSEFRTKDTYDCSKYINSLLSNLLAGNYKQLELLLMPTI